MGRREQEKRKSQRLASENSGVSEAAAAKDRMSCDESSATPKAKSWRKKRGQGATMQGGKSSHVVAAENRMTTLLIRNVPKSYDKQAFMFELDQMGFEDKYDYVYLSFDKDDDAANATRVNTGCAVVNFEDTDDAVLCKGELHGYRFAEPDAAGKEKVAAVSYAKRQGLRQNLEDIKDEFSLSIDDNALSQLPWVKNVPPPAVAKLLSVRKRYAGHTLPLSQNILGNSSNQLYSSLSRRWCGDANNKYYENQLLQQEGGASPTNGYMMSVPVAFVPVPYGNLQWSTPVETPVYANCCSGSSRAPSEYTADANDAGYFFDYDALELVMEEEEATDGCNTQATVDSGTAGATPASHGQHVSSTAVPSSSQVVPVLPMLLSPCFRNQFEAVDCCNSLFANAWCGDSNRNRGFLMSQTFSSSTIAAESGDGMTSDTCQHLPNTYSDDLDSTASNTDHSLSMRTPSPTFDWPLSHGAAGDDYQNGHYH